MSTYKVINIFGQEEARFLNKKKAKPNLFSKHEEFVEKFKPKKTTDDCYTPDAVYAIVLDYVGKNFDLSGMEIVRPFYPGADFELIDYPDNCIVIDNPPFSIISKIAKYYIKNGVRFFLFAPHLTLFSADIDCTHIVVGADIVYENGATVKTSFLSNIFGEYKVIGEPDLFFSLNAINKKASLPKYEYPGNVLTVSHVAWMVEKGVGLRIGKHSVKHCRQLDAQRIHDKAIFGSGFLISEKAAAEKAAAEKAAAEKAAAEKAAAEKAAAEKVNITTWPLSEKEKRVIKSLD